MYTLGLDLGQSSDYSALVVTEQQPTTPSSYHVRHLQRFPLQTPYPEIVSQVTELLLRPPLTRDTPLVVDRTGVGAPVCDLFAGLPGLVPVVITGGEVTHFGDGSWKVPKRSLVSVTQVLLQTGRLKFAEGLPEVQTLVNELLAFEVKVSEAGHDSYGSWREGAHDDLVLGLSLCAWYAEAAPQPWFGAIESPPGRPSWGVANAPAIDWGGVGWGQPQRRLR